jgi:4-aminobutyrate aminotransferase-like enzyme/Ser/Thr protein kinase RdoA (MazF antagonist)
VTPQGRVATPVTTVEAEALARRLYGVEAHAEALPGEYDDNFRLAAADGRQLVLKVMHPLRERSLVDVQVAVLEHLQRRAPGLVLPRVLATISGERVSALPDPADPRGGATRLVWMLSFIPGTTLAAARPRTPEMLASLGRLLGEMDRALADFDHPGADRELQWDLQRVGGIGGSLRLIADPKRRALASQALARYEAEVRPALPRLRRGVIHGDANDHNVVVADPRQQPREVVSVVDFGDLHRGLVAAEPAVAAAYAGFGDEDPVGAAAAVIGGYHAAYPLEEREIALLHPLIAGRLALSVVTAARRRQTHAGDPYVTISEAPAWETLERLMAVPAPLAHARFRAACGLPPIAGGPALVGWLRAQDPAPVLDLDLRTSPCLVLDLSVGSTFTGADPSALETGPLTERIFAAMKRAGARVGVGRYDEARAFYTSSRFAASSDDPLEERRTVHLGIDLFVEPGSVVKAPLAGEVHLVADNQAPGDYGPLVILRHAMSDRTVFFTLYGHLDESRPEGLVRGRRVARGQTIGRVGTPPGNGDWPPHLHLQLILDLLDMDADFPGVAKASQREVWKAFSPDPNVLLRIPEAPFPAREPAPAATLAARRARLGPNVRLSYRRPLEAVRGFGAFLYDETGRAYLDVYNNVPLVGHSHPQVVRAAAEQLALLNTNTRYLHDNVVRYAARLARLLPEPLCVCYFLNSGSEANELALRLARARTGREDVIVLEHGYHGHTTSLVDASPHKFEGPGGRGRRHWVHVAPLPDTFRGRYRRDDPEAGLKYARHVGEIVESLRTGVGVAAFLAETLPSVGGQVVFPPGYLAEAYRLVREAGGVCIADEVQTGFGRLGTHMWGFETQGVVPDIVALGKPIGNGFPLAAVVTTPAIARAFDDGMEFFSTFGGNPVACAAGLAVLDVLEEERLQERALRVGRHLAGGLHGLMERHPIVGDVRGLGLYLGVELVRDRTTLEPATEEAAYVVERLRERGVLTGTDGPHRNVLKIRPPLVLSEADADLFVSVLASVLEEDGAQPAPPGSSP